MHNPTLRTIILVFFITLIFLFIGYLVGNVYGLLFALILALIVNFISYFYSKEMVLSFYPTEPIEDEEIVSMVKELIQKAKMPMPELYYANVNYPNAFATGRNPENSAVVITRPLVDILDKEELKAVIGHELGHIYNRDVLIQTLVASLGTALTFFINFIYLFKTNEEEVSWLDILAIYLTALIVFPLIQLAISREREYAADEFSARITCNPDALASALQKIEEYYYTSEVQPVINPSHQHLMIFSPSELFSSHPPTEKRIERLMELKKELNC